MIRAMAVGDIKLKDWLAFYKRNLSIFVSRIDNGDSCFYNRHFQSGFDIAVVISLTMVLIVMVGSLIGMSLPFIFRKMRLDPATASAPLITSVADIVGVLIYFSIASWYLDL